MERKGRMRKREWETLIKHGWKWMDEELHFLKIF